MKSIKDAWNRMTHQHELKPSKEWAMFNGDLVCARRYACDCGYKEPPDFLLIATAADIAEAMSKQITADRSPKE